MAEAVKLTKEQKEINDLKTQLLRIEKRCEVAEQRVASLVAFSKAAYETNNDLLNQIEGATKTNRKLHQVGAQNLGQLIRTLEKEAK